MVRGRKPKVAKQDAASDAVDNTAPNETTSVDLDVGNPVIQVSKQKAGKNLAESSNPSFEKKIDFLVQSVQEFMSKGTKRSFVNEDQALELTYKSLCLESQKTVESLRKENLELSRKLDSAMGKLQVYEEMKDAFVLMKEMTVVSNVTKATEVFVNYISQLTNDKSALHATVTEPNAALPQETSRQGTIATEQAVTITQVTTVGGGTSSGVSTEQPGLGRGKRQRKKKEW